MANFKKFKNNDLVYIKAILSRTIEERLSTTGNALRSTENWLYEGTGLILDYISVYDVYEVYLFGERAVNWVNGRDMKKLI